MNRNFSLSAWGPSANFDLLRLRFDWLRDPGGCYFSVTACLFGFGVYFAFHPSYATREEVGDITDAWLETTHVVVPTPEYGALVADAEAWRAYQASQRPDYLADFGPNVPVEDLGGKPVYYENNQPVYPGREKAP